MQLLAGLDTKIAAGEAGLATLIGVMSQPDILEALNLISSSQVLVLGTEGATDPQLFEQLTGMKPA